MTTEREKCEKLYGPYPSQIPVPFLDKEHTKTPPAPKVLNAKSWREIASYPDHRDVGTPDEWYPRDGRLIRLTGRHPFNCEPPAAELNKHKFITPSSLHYVRNHGACPKLTWEDHTLTCSFGCKSNGDTVGDADAESAFGSKKEIFTMDQLTDTSVFTQRSLPVTLVCAGNRRKEQNMIRQTIGFNWGASGVSTNVYTGVLCKDLFAKLGFTYETLEEAGVDIEDYHVEFIGQEDLPNKVGPGPFEEAPWPKQVKYGTSLPLSRVLNPAYDVMVAYEANGEPLQPDHGYPLRLIIPGYIGGRMIKWITQINIIKHETYNHYHYHDNRILPPHITAEKSLAEGWWYRPEYIFNELNINSATCAPDHNELLCLKTNLTKKYNMAGYAYTGGGRKISRVEISTNEGVNWQVANLNRTEKPTKYGMHWCWVWWNFEVDVSELMTSKEVWVRAWDESSNVQPTNPTWNLMGMGNNQAFRVKVHIVNHETKGPCLTFEHPTQAGQTEGGWMTKLAYKPVSAGYGLLLEEAALEPATDGKSEKKIVSKDGKQKYTLEEIAKHKSEEDGIWIIVNDRVYDCTEYMELHPGGVDSILINAGMDSTEDFEAIHSTKAHQILEKYYIGDVDKDSSKASIAEDALVCAKTGRQQALNPKKKTDFKLVDKIVLSHDSFLLTFALPTPEHVLGLPTGKHIFLSADIDGETVLRRYTPISSDADLGVVKFVLKAYRPCAAFPKGGKMSQYLDNMKIGDFMSMRGPVGEFDYSAAGVFTIDGEECKASKFNMIAGGTGITPCMQIASEILRNSKTDHTKISLVFACREEGDLLMRTTLDAWEEAFPKQFSVHYILSDNWSEDWIAQGYSTGFVNKELFEKVLYSPASDVYNLMCGPPVMLERGCVPNLVALGHSKKSIFSF